MALIAIASAILIRVPAAWGERELQELSLGMRTFSGRAGARQ